MLRKKFIRHHNKGYKLEERVVGQQADVTIIDDPIEIKTGDVVEEPEEE